MKEEFQLDGYWWLPDQRENQIFGQLSFVPGDKLDLKLHGALSSPPQKELFLSTELIEPTFVHGFDVSNGNAVTLYKCRQTSYSTTLNGLEATSFYAMAAFRGVHFSENTEVKFKTISVRFSNLEEWANKRPIRSEHINNEWRKLVIRYEQPDSISTLVNGLEIKIAFYGPNESGLGSNKLSLSYETRVDICSQQEMQFEECLTIIRRLQGFFSLAMGGPTFPISIKGTSDANKEILENGKEIFPFIDIYYLIAWWPLATKEFHHFQMLFTLNTIQENFASYFRNWMEKYDLIEPSINLYLSVLFNPNSYAEVRYLSLAQALETYHQRIFGGKYQADDQYQNELYRNLLSAIPSTLDKDFKNSLQNRLRFGNEFSLRKRLRELLESIEDVLDFEFVRSKAERERFVSKAVDTRNYWTHYTPDLEGNAAQTSEERFVLITRFQLLLETRFLMELGFDKQEIPNLIQRSERFKVLKAKRV